MADGRARGSSLAVIKVLVDVNLAPAWTETLAANRIEAVQWTTIGDPRAGDEELLRYARERGYVVFTPIR
jgi:predicted nuclease of predicted toxin-antitoxin system